MSQVRINFLKNGTYYTDGQNLTSKEDAMMPTEKVRYYMNRSAKRGLIFTFEPEVIEVSEEDAEWYADWGYEILH